MMCVHVRVQVRGVLCGGMEAYIAAGYPAMSRHRINLVRLTQVKTHVYSPR